MSKDYAAMRLKAHGDPMAMWNILQEECRDKTAKKLARTLAEYPGFTFPSLAVAEMATSDDIAQLHTAIAGQPETVLDMTCGLGIDAFAFARAGAKITAIDIDPATAECARCNAKLTELDVDVITSDSVKWLEDNPLAHFSLIFVDPARRDSSGRHFTLADCHPDVTRILPMLMKRADTVMIKASPMLSVNELSSYNADVHVIGTTRECKEMVYVISSQSSSQITCHTVGKPAYVVENKAIQQIRQPQTGEFLLQPWPSVMKGGGAASISAWNKLHPFSHLFVSEDVPTDFPGEAFEIIDILPFNKRSIKEFSSKYPKINVATRNFPISAPELAKRLKINEGGELLVFGTTLCDDSKVLIVTRMPKKSASE